MKEKKHTIKYCRECGSKLIVKEYQANKVEQMYCCELGSGYIPLGSAYNQFTGEPNMVEVRTCPMYKNELGVFGRKNNWHDILTVKDGYVDYGDVRIKS